MNLTILRPGKKRARDENSRMLPEIATLLTTMMVVHIPQSTMTRQKRAVSKRISDVGKLLIVRDARLPGSHYPLPMLLHSSRMSASFYGEILARDIPDRPQIVLSETMLLYSPLIHWTYYHSNLSHHQHRRRFLPPDLKSKIHSSAPRRNPPRRSPPVLRNMGQS